MRKAIFLLFVLSTLLVAASEAASEYKASASRSNGNKLKVPETLSDGEVKVSEADEHYFPNIRRDIWDEDSLNAAVRSKEGKGKKASRRSNSYKKRAKKRITKAKKKVKKTTKKIKKRVKKAAMKKGKKKGPPKKKKKAIRRRRAAKKKKLRRRKKKTSGSTVYKKKRKGSMKKPSKRRMKKPSKRRRKKPSKPSPKTPKIVTMPGKKRRRAKRAKNRRRRTGGRRGRKGRRKSKKPYSKPKTPGKPSPPQHKPSGYVGGQTDEYPAQCKCQPQPDNEGVCYDMSSKGKVGWCKRRPCTTSYECVPGGGADLMDCIRRIAVEKVRFIHSYHGKDKCERVLLTKPKVFYTLY